MPSLHELQRTFLAALMGDQPHLVHDSVAAVQFTAEERLRVYQNNLFISLTDALSATYPVVEKLVGGGFFAYMANQFVRKHPSRSGNLHNFGAELGDFISNFEPAASLPYLTDVAHLEWTRHRTYHAADSETLDLRELQKVSPERYGDLRFRLHPSAGLVSSSFPILQIWAFNQEDAACQNPVNLDSGGECALLLRRGADIVMKRIPASEHALLERFNQDAPLSTAVDAALSIDPDFDLENTLRHHIALGAVVALDLS